MNAAKPCAKTAFRVNQPQDLVHCIGTLSGSQYRVNLAVFIARFASKCPGRDDGKDEAALTDC